MGKITRSIPVAHSNGQKLGGLLHYVQAASNHTGREYRRGVRGKELLRAAVHRTGVYQTRYADYIIRDVFGSHRSWRTHRRAEPHARAPRYRNAPAQTDCFELALDGTSKRWSGVPAVHVAVYGMGREDRTWMEFPLNPYAVKMLTRKDVTPKSVRIHRETLDVVYDREVADREPEQWVGIDMNGNNNTYAFADGSVAVERNDFAQQYNRLHGKIARVKRKRDRRIMERCQAKAWKSYKNHVREHTRKEASVYAKKGIAVGYEKLDIHKLTTKKNGMAPYVRGKQKSTLNTGQRRQAIISAAESNGLPHTGVDPRGTSANCLECGKGLKRSVTWTKDERSMWCQPCKKIRERDGNAAANIKFRAISSVIMAATGLTGAGERNMTLPAVLSLLKDAIHHPAASARERQTWTDIMRLLEGRSAGAEWRPPGAHKPGRQSSAGDEPAGGPGAGVFGRNGPGPPDAAKLCDCA